MIRLIAFDLDGTITQHKTKMTPQARATMTALSEKYALLMCGAGMCRRIFEQMDRFPLDIIGNYGMQEATVDKTTGELVLLADANAPCDRPSCEERVTFLRQKHGFTKIWGDNVEYHASGCVTFPCLGTDAPLDEKLAFDPDRSRRRAIYEEVCGLFPEYTVFVGGTSSFDMAPAPYNKAYALRKYAKEHGFAPEEVAFVGDDYGPGGNDESVYLSEFRFVKIDDYRDFPRIMKETFLSD